MRRRTWFAQCGTTRGLECPAAPNRRGPGPGAAPRKGATRLLRLWQRPERKERRPACVRQAFEKPENRQPQERRYPNKMASCFARENRLKAGALLLRAPGGPCKP